MSIELTLGASLIILAALGGLTYLFLSEHNDRIKAEKACLHILNEKIPKIPNRPPIPKIEIPPTPKFQTGDKVYFVEPTIFTPLGASDLQDKVITGVIVSRAGTGYYIVATDSGLSRISCYGLNERDWLTNKEKCIKNDDTKE